uniref:Mannosyl-oligosaccharide glucosidase n=1 Tax=Gasterosteus aculeatus aculeatus TaxID=481459 RepID=A0AAQ4R8E3_GASAC
MARRMGRQRKRVVAGEAVPLLRKDDKPPAFHRKDKKKKVDIGKVFINISIGLCIFSLAWFFYALHMRSSLAKRVVTPHPSPRVLDANSSSAAVSADRFWGSYRPQVYFGMKTRSSRSIVAGMMWMRQFADMDVNLRHTCEQGDRLQGYGWLMHDGITFGVQEIRDSDFTLTTEFVKRMGGDHGGDWTWRVTAKQHVSAGFFSAPQAPVLSLMFYTAADTQGSLEAHLEDGKRLASVTGFSKELGNFKITFRKPVTGELSTSLVSRYNYLQTVSPGLEKLTDIVKQSLNRRFIYSPPSGEKRHYIAVDTYQPPHQSKPADPRKESDFVVHQVTVQMPFQIEVLFESGSFHRRPNQLVGSVMTQELERRKAEFDSKFEKTFGLEGKGFSQSQVKFGKAALSNMLGGMGYFYGESVVQSVYNEYPLLYPEGALFTAVPSRSFFPRGFLWDEGFTRRLCPLDRPDEYEGWIPREQILGDEARRKVPAEFVVQRNENANPPTLFLALQELIEQLSSKAEEPASRPTLPFLRRLFPRLKTWFDWYNTTQTGPLPNSYRWRGRDKDTNLFLNPKTLTSGLDDYPRASHPSADERHVDLHCWMALSSGIMASIARLLDSNKLWTPYGLRSLSRADPLYMKRNTEHDAPYWRGPIWININYLAVRALHHYSNAEGPHREKAAALYQELRTNIINNVYRQYAETGYVWEQYNDGTGRGQGSHPFTGWSALTVLMMAEQY